MVLVEHCAVMFAKYVFTRIHTYASSYITAKLGKIRDNSLSVLYINILFYVLGTENSIILGHRKIL